MEKEDREPTVIKDRVPEDESWLARALYLVPTVE